MVSDRLVNIALDIEAWADGVKDDYGLGYAREIIERYNVTTATMKIVSEMQCISAVDEDMLEYIDIVLELDNDTA